MTDPVDTEARRLFVSAALSTHAARRLRGRVAPGAAAGDLLDGARSLGEGSEAVERRYRLRFEPPYPGVTAGPEAVGGGSRLLLACAASDDGGAPLGVVFTVLIPGRSPQVSVAPPGTPVPEEWRTPDGSTS